MCECDTNHSGENCEVVQCENCDGYCIHNTNKSTDPKSPKGTCVNNNCNLHCANGECVNTNGISRCKCNEGFSGELCQHHDCKKKCKNGFCNAENKCRCYKNFQGEWCEESKILIEKIKTTNP